MAGTGSDLLYVRAYDGTQWGAWTLQTITTGEVPPVVAVTTATPTILKNQTETLASVFSASDVDSSDPVTQYEVYFGNTGNPPLGTVTLNGTAIGTQQIVNVGSSLSGLVYTGSATTGSDLLYVRAYDGTQWGAWTQQTITTGDVAPVVAVTNATPTILKNQTETLASVFSGSDVNASDPVTQYEVYFGNTGNPPLGTVTLNGTAIGTQQIVNVGSSLSGLVYTGGATAGTDLLYVRAYDGTQWGAWTQQSITTGSTGESLASQAGSLVAAMASFGAQNASPSLVVSDAASAAPLPTLVPPHH
jgi:hypothetical protein